ncbi:hypothetical protein [Streptomyces sp. NPDC017964]|uniref:hypothetical protein n=1 Tax=Streptomyces sp. NPDC017964 TaxID=3365022 RepID=UPI003795D713
MGGTAAGGPTHAALPVVNQNSGNCLLRSPDNDPVLRSCLPYDFLQMWGARSNPDGTVTFSNVGMGLRPVCLTAQSSQVVTENCNGSTAQKWVLRTP